MRIREYEPGDEACLSALFDRVRREEFFWADKAAIAPDDFARATRGERLWVAEQDGEPIGFVSVWEPTRFIHLLFVSSACRGRGAARALIQRAAEVCGTPLTLKCVQANERALRFYLRGGWVVAGEGTGEDGPYALLRYAPRADGER